MKSMKRFRRRDNQGKTEVPIYAVIDTNVLVSALMTKNMESPTVKVKNAVFTGKIIPLFHELILNEYTEVLYRDKRKINILIQVHI